MTRKRSGICAFTAFRSRRLTVFHFATALEIEGSDHETEEIRTTLLGKIKRQTCVFVFTRRAGRVRVISLRYATAEERRLYIEAKGY
jgi:uncharacterized DUF497 family protein